ncbi:MAG: 50S ribosomal protein L21 [Parcubacteria group bacterium GW2011_GWA2_42_35]|nr:MAG: 50S ribosomal protein L21 [Parcubacteria group bacterium GW2011_GWA2_42_35]
MLKCFYMILAVIETGGKQYLIKPGDKLKVEKLVPGKTRLTVGQVFNFDKVLLVVKDDKINIGNPYIKNVKIKAEYLREGRAKKIIVRKYKSKTRYRKTQGHRQPFSEVLIKDF